MGAMLGLGMLGGMAGGGGASSGGLLSTLGAFTSAGLRVAQGQAEAESYLDRAVISGRRADQYAMRAEDAMRVAESRADAMRRRAGAGDEQAELAGLEARGAALAGKASANTLRENLRRTLSTQRAIFGASGVRADEGTPEVIAASSRAEAEYDVGMIERNAAMASAAKRISGANRLSLLADADMARLEGQAYRRQAGKARSFGFMQGGLSLLDFAQRKAYIG
jgi:hypothetical protein